MAPPRKELKLRIYRAATAVGAGHEIVHMLRNVPEGASFSQILSRTKLNPNTLTRKLWRLMEEGIVDRKIVTPDEKRRYSFYQLTPEGKRFIAKLEELDVLKK